MGYSVFQRKVSTKYTGFSFTLDYTNIKDEFNFEIQPILWLCCPFKGVWVKEKLLSLRADINKAPIFFASDLKLLYSSQAWKQFKKVIIQAKLMPEGVKETRTFNDLRHTHASNLIDKEVYPPKIMKRLGHASLKIIMDNYAHFFDKHDKKMIDTLVAIQGDKRGTFLVEPR